MSFGSGNRPFVAVVPDNDAVVAHGEYAADDGSSTISPTRSGASRTTRAPARTHGHRTDTPRRTRSRSRGFVVRRVYRTRHAATLSSRSCACIVRGNGVDDVIDLAVQDARQVVDRQPECGGRSGDPAGSCRCGSSPSVRRCRPAACARRRSRSACSLLRLVEQSARSTVIAFVRFLSCERSSWQTTTMPVGRCVMRTAVATLLTFWPPAPPEWKMSMLQIVRR